MPRFLTPSVGRSKVLWVGLSGQSLELAAQNDEVNLYARYGALNLASMILATAIGFFFVYLAWAPPSAHHSDLPRLLAACGAGLLVGRAILAMDQFVVASAVPTGGVIGLSAQARELLGPRPGDRGARAGWLLDAHAAARERTRDELPAEPQAPRSDKV